MLTTDATNGFKRKYKKLSRELKEKAKEKEKIFKTDPFDSRLGTHKLHGKDKSFWAYSITKSVRIKFEFLGNSQVLYIDVGPHDEVYQ